MRVLDLGSSSKDDARILWPNADVVRLDINPESGADILCDITSPEFLELEGGYDGIYASHVLEHLAIKHLMPVCEQLVRMLNVGGRLHIHVPSLEWAAREFYFEHPSPVAIFHIYGGQGDDWQFHKNGFTMLALRQLMNRLGLVTALATTVTYEIEYDGKRYPAEQHIVEGIRGK